MQLDSSKKKFVTFVESNDDNFERLINESVSKVEKIEKNVKDLNKKLDNLYDKVHSQME